MTIVFSRLALSAPPDVPRMGILVLDTRFPRIPGDVGNPDTWPFPTLLRTISGASPLKVAGAAAEGFVDAFVAAGQELAAGGACGIITTCGFLVRHQRVLAERLPVPVATSSLLQYATIARMLPSGRRVGILTYSKEFLLPAYLLAAGADPDTPVEGVPSDGAFFTVITHGGAALDHAAMEEEVVEAARRLLARHPDVGALLVECANMPPYAAALRRETGLPVFDAYGFFNAFYRAIRPAAFAGSSVPG